MLPVYGRYARLCLLNSELSTDIADAPRTKMFKTVVTQGNCTVWNVVSNMSKVTLSLLPFLQNYAGTVWY